MTIGSLVELTYDCEWGDPGHRGIIVQCWIGEDDDPPSYTVILQSTGQRAIFYANELRVVAPEKTS